jgi:hypothetical protein
VASIQPHSSASNSIIITRWLSLLTIVRCSISTTPLISLQLTNHIPNLVPFCNFIRTQHKTQTLRNPSNFNKN